jgi:hypothetical protein
MQVIVNPPGLPGNPGRPTIVIGQPSIEGLIAQRTELERQLSQINDQRRDLQRQRDQATEARRAALDGRLATMDARTARVEEQLAQVNEQVATAMAANPQFSRTRITTGSGALDPSVRGQIEDAAQDGALAGFALGTSSLLGLFILWRGFRRFILRRKPKTPAALPDHSVAIQHLQQSMDAIAIEVERISEAQRFSAKLLKEKVRVE